MSIMFTGQGRLVAHEQGLVRDMDVSCKVHAGLIVSKRPLSYVSQGFNSSNLQALGKLRVELFAAAQLIGLPSC